MGSQDTLAEQLAEISRRLEALERRSFTIPELDQDPPSDDPVKLWGFNDGRLRRRMPDGTVKQYLADTVSGPSTSTVLLPIDPVPEVTYDDTFPADWAATYTGDGIYRETGALLAYGLKRGGESVFGQQKVMVSFQTVTTALAGSEIQDVELILEILGTEGSSGTILYFGTHLATVQPDQYEYLSLNNFRVLSDNNSRIRCRLSTSFGEQLRDGGIAGFVIDQPSDSRAYAGSLSRNVSLRVIYVR